MKYRAKVTFVSGQVLPVALCGCRFCENEFLRLCHLVDPGGWHRGFGFIVCPECGNKRCERATFHDHLCRRSNEPGQPLSIYGNFELDTSWMDGDDDD